MEHYASGKMMMQPQQWPTKRSVGVLLSFPGGYRSAWVRGPKLVDCEARSDTFPMLVERCGFSVAASAPSIVDSDFEPLAEERIERASSPVLVRKEAGIYSSQLSQFTQLPISSFSYLVLKRLIDVAVSGALLLLLSPVLLAVVCAVWASSPGPLLYCEQRVGRFGRHFTIYKFRSMYTKEYLRDVLGYRESEHTQMQRRMEKQSRDPRVTAVGAILRKLSLDELPQLINVLKGDMSLIGPRPVVDAELTNYGGYAAFYKMMYPGLSGLWQVSGRNDVSYKSRVRKDVAYCKRWSPLLDVAILARTVPVVIKGRGAY